MVRGLWLNNWQEVAQLRNPSDSESRDGIVGSCFSVSCLECMCFQDVLFLGYNNYSKE